MKNSLKLSVQKVFYAFSFILAGLSSFGQVITYPTYSSRANENLEIAQIEHNEYNTIISYVYRADNQYVKGGWFNINPEIKIRESAGNKIYSLLRAEGVKLAPERTNCDYGGQIFSFRLIFPRIHNDIQRIDIIECSSSNCFNFYGVDISSLSISKTSEDLSFKQFRRDYNYFAVYDSESSTWSEWKPGENTFVLNYNSNNDIAHYQGNGELVIYRRVSNVEEATTSSGDHYQILNALDENGTRFQFQFFDDVEIGLKLIYGNVMVQFAYL